MKIMIELPTWLGDTVMTTPAIENIVAQYPDCSLVVFGSYVSTKVFEYHPSVERIIIDERKQGLSRYTRLYALAKNIGKIDMAISFRKNFSTKFLFFFINASQKYIYTKYTEKQIHQVIRYNDFINKSLHIHATANGLKIYLPVKHSNSETKEVLGINPGATYGSAKRWYPESFAKVAMTLSERYDIIIFGGPGEVEIANDIEKYFIENGITNYKNVAGKTSVLDLIEAISKLSLFITADSGPMHVAAAFNIPTVALFGPTKDKETSQWHNPNSKIVKKEMACAPCMKRTCPLKHHECMKLISPEDVLEAVEALSLS